MSYLQRNVEDFFDNEYRDYAIYTVENRAIPSLVDGFKPSQRKIAFAANKLWKTGNEKPLKVFQLGGQAAAMSFFHHGSLDGTIIGMTQKFKNSMPIFEGIGQFGSLRSPTAGAPRYVGVKFNENFRLLYKDFELVTRQFEEGEEIEPRFFLPVIPTVLLNGGSGIAVGFATNILNRNPLDVINASIAVLSGKKCPVLKPWISEFRGEVLPVENMPKSWGFYGKFEVKNTSTVEVTEIPPGFTYEKYESYLDSLQEKGKISSYDDHSSEFPHYILRFPRAVLASLLEKDQLSRLLKMRQQEGENFTVLDENGKIKTFDSAEELLVYFVEFRLGYYQKRKDLIMKKLQEEISMLDVKIKFLSAVIEKKISIMNIPKEEILKKIYELQILKEGSDGGFLLSMPIYTLTFEKYQELLERKDSKVKEHDIITSTKPVEMYMNDLKELRKKIKQNYC
jgi:DNA gyrase/topoisomerase IV subunit A